MNETIKSILERRTIRRYKPEQIAEEILKTILEAGLYAPNAGGKQSCVMVVCQDAALNEKLGKINKSVMADVLEERGMTPKPGTVSAEQPSILDDSSIKSAFYGAPTVVTLFASKAYNQTGDCFAAAQNIMLAAHALGVGSCIVARAVETFSSEEGQNIQKEWGLDEHFEAKVHITLGYPDGNKPLAKPRKDDRIKRI